MNLEIAEEFYLKLYESLKSNIKLQDHDCRVYVKAPKEAKYPFLTINYRNVTWKNLHDIAQYELEIDFNLFIKSNNAISIATNIFKIVSQNIIEVIGDFADLDVIAFHGSNLLFELSKDLLVDKIVNKFQITLQEKIV
ncbi:MAG: hypothetical protein K9G11_00760 [Rickettsiaceae bacterium]|nr:hypothetical protein [Rickettsiaceae bacterium]